MRPGAWAGRNVRSGRDGCAGRHRRFGVGLIGGGRPAGKLGLESEAGNDRGARGLERVGERVVARFLARIGLGLEPADVVRRWVGFVAFVLELVRPPMVGLIVLE